jgi:butyryl-CoA dehydrogenase
MARRFVSERNLRFMLHELFDLEELTRTPHFRHHQPRGLDMTLQAALDLARRQLLPLFTPMDRQSPELTGGRVRVHPQLRRILHAFGQGGWLTSRLTLARGGEQLPHLVADACSFIFAAANYSASVYPELTAGAAHLIESFGSQSLRDTFLPPMYRGVWQGTMALTEPEAGSSLSDIATAAEPDGPGCYRIRGVKIFISAGDHDGVENVVHLLLARITGAPAGARGISLFVVPRQRIDGSGHLVANDVLTSGIFHKLGYRGCPIVQLSFGDRGQCRGWLVGQPHRGLAYMFQMMNAMRVGVGLGAAAIATAAYYAALDYSRTRLQGRPISAKDSGAPPVAIITHADVKRMLLFQRAVAEGSLSLLLQCSRYMDLQLVCTDALRERYRLLLELLTPVAKSYPAEMGVLATSQGLQCLGGSGYCDDYPLEQHFRDSRIHPIHEGTTGIQGLDLLGRKVSMEHGEALRLFGAEVAQAISRAGQDPQLADAASALGQAMQRLETVTQHLARLAADQGPERALADATLYLQLFGIVAVAWQWLLQGTVAQRALPEAGSRAEQRFYRGKLATMRYFYDYELPATLGLSHCLLSGTGLTAALPVELFDD